MKKGILLIVGLLLMVAGAVAQDSYNENLTTVARIGPKFPEGDRSHYGLWAKDRLLDRPVKKPKFESPEDSLRKVALFVHYCGKAFEFYRQKDATNTVLYGDSALRTGFDNRDLYLFMGYSYEALGDDAHATDCFKTAKKRGFPSAKFAYSEFKKRKKARKKAAASL